MQFRALFFGFIIVFPPVAALAGGGHHHGNGHSHSSTQVDQATAKTRAAKAVAGLIKKNVLNKSWGTVSASSAEKKVFKGQTEWVVVFMNNKITDTSKQRLYVFMTLSGDYIAANYTGK